MMQAAIFDMDGLLVESESCWRRAEQEMSDELGLGLGPADFEATMGVRMGEVAELWYARTPWVGPSPAEVAARTTARVVELLADAEPLPGVGHALDLADRLGHRVALCSSSDRAMIETVVARLGIADRFEVLHSAAEDTHGKPHPEPYLLTAAELGVDPTRCVVFEDSVTGCLAGKAARMRVVAVPAPGDRGDRRFGFVDHELSSLAEVTEAHLR